MLVLEALWGSTVLRTIALVFSGLLAFKGYGLLKEYQGEAQGKAQVISQVKAKTDKDTRQAAQARAQAGGSSGQTDPYARER